MADLEKIADDLSSLTVIEAAELSKLLEEKWGVSAAAPVAVAAAGRVRPRLLPHPRSPRPRSCSRRRCRDSRSRISSSVASHVPVTGMHETLNKPVTSARCRLTGDAAQKCCH